MEQPINEYVVKYGEVIEALALAVVQVAREKDARGLHFLIETCDAVLSRGLQIIGGKQAMHETGWADCAIH